MLRLILGFFLIIVLIINAVLQIYVLYRLPSKTELQEIKNLVRVVKVEKKYENLIVKLNNMQSILNRVKNEKIYTKDSTNSDTSSTKSP